jgi:hypothetical protein
LSLASETLIVNHVSMSSLWYFVAVWVDFKKVLGKIKAFLCNYLWCGFENMAKACVSWDDCTMPKKVGDLVLLPWRVLWEHLWVNGLFKHFYPTSQICKPCQGTASHNCNVLIMALGVHPFSSCFLPISSSKVAQKFGATLRNYGRW